MRYKDEIRITKERMIKFIESNPNWEIDFYSKSKIRNSYFLEKEMHGLFWWCKLGKTIPQIFTNRVSSSSLSKRNKKKRCYMKDGVTEWFHLPENILNFMLRNKESFK